MARRVTIGSKAASELLGISQQLTSYWGKSGRLRAVRKHPTLRFRVVDILAYREAMKHLPPERRGRPRKTQLETIMQEALSV